MTIHILKTWPAYFQSVWEKEKTFEYRVNDRDYKTDDVLMLREYDPDNGYSGRRVVCKVGYIMFGGVFGLPECACIMSLRSMKNVNAGEVLVDGWPLDEL